MERQKWRFGNEGRAVLTAAVLGLLALATTPALAQKANVSIETSRDTNGCTEIKIKVVPNKVPIGIQDVHLLVGQTRHGPNGEATLYGDSMTRGYQAPCLRLPRVRPPRLSGRWHDISQIADQSDQVVFRDVPNDQHAPWRCRQRGRATARRHLQVRVENVPRIAQADGGRRSRFRRRP